MNPTFLDIQSISNDNYVAFTFFIGCMAMMAASAFFFFEMGNMEKKWRTSILVSGLITFIAAVHYYYMRDYNLATGESPTFFRYVDWLLTVPLKQFILPKNKAGYGVLSAVSVISTSYILFGLVM